MRQVRSYRVEPPSGEWPVPTQPGWEQLITVERGGMRVRVGDRIWLLAPRTLLRLPRGAVATATGRALLSVVYLPSDRDDEAVVLELSDLAVALVRRLGGNRPLPLADPVVARLVAVLLDELREAPISSTRLRMPEDPLCRRAAERVLATPGASIDEVLADLPISRRTLERRFADETGLSPSRWQRVARVAEASRLLLDGRSVSSVAVGMGYSTPSALTAMLRAETGRSPRELLRTAS
jgi:AraC-like DNA-binding protein